MLILLLRTKVPRNESKERKFLGTKPEDKSSTYETFVPKKESSWV